MQAFQPSETPSVESSYLQSLSRNNATALEDAIFENYNADSLELSPNMDGSRRESFAAGPSLFSPKSEDWQGVDMQSIPSGNPFVDQQQNVNVTSFGQGATHEFNPQAAMWPMRGNVSGTSPQQVENITEMDPTFQMMGATMSFNHPNMFTPATGQMNHNMAAAIVPKEWSRSSHMPAREQQTAQSISDARQEGIRKRNTRFEIPPEHNLGNIDHLIAQSTDEHRIKELKAQKRLLRNRQAALDSRQRKKLHTERLEDEKKQFNAVVADMEVELNAAKAELERLRRENQTYVGYADNMAAQKEEMIRAHTVEARELRKKNALLTEHIQRLEGNVTTPTSPSNAFDAGDLSDMAMPGNWDSSTFAAGNFTSGTLVEKSETTKVDTALPTADVDHDKASSQGGLLFMLFLVGAFVMSSRSANPTIPRASEDIRQASAALLDTVLRDAGITQLADTIQAAGPQPSGVNWQSPSAPVDTSSLEGAANNILPRTGDQQSFAMAAEQYSGMSDQEFLQHLNPPQDHRVPNQGRKSLAEALENLQQTSRQAGMAEVYTRSLLWNKVPNDVVRNFAKMVVEGSHGPQTE
ncbi:hypothetical protein VHEMI06293 [[Torrubiella] hemipterigena]|uniref:BZIP domain-containing protein n=1 Tax=[Torrubiella] hemipterigena TaxID=1531966 RepID=A0A0A1TJ16_9HYPO|nr:hypothetical protein VHEMI06293 [[Torrubiella] hemipterigena]